GVALLARRWDDQVRVDGDAAARLAQEQTAQRVVAGERLHLLEDRGARRRQHAPDDDVADLAARVAADDGDQPLRPHAGDATSVVVGDAVGVAAGRLCPGSALRRVVRERRIGCGRARLGLAPQPGLLAQSLRLFAASPRLFCQLLFLGHTGGVPERRAGYARRSNSRRATARTRTSVSALTRAVRFPFGVRSARSPISEPGPSAVRRSGASTSTEPSSTT